MSSGPYSQNVRECGAIAFLCRRAWDWRRAVELNSRTRRFIRPERRSRVLQLHVERRTLARVRALRSDLIDL